MPLIPFTWDFNVQIEIEQSRTRKRHLWTCINQGLVPVRSSHKLRWRVLSFVPQPSGSTKSQNLQMEQHHRTLMLYGCPLSNVPNQIGHWHLQAGHYCDIAALGLLRSRVSARLKVGARIDHALVIRSSINAHKFHWQDNSKALTSPNIPP